LFDCLFQGRNNVSKYIKFNSKFHAFFSIIFHEYPQSLLFCHDLSMLNYHVDPTLQFFRDCNSPSPIDALFSAFSTNTVSSTTAAAEAGTTTAAAAAAAAEARTTASNNKRPLQQQNNKRPSWFFLSLKLLSIDYVESTKIQSRK
jgi:hypothetical protein